MLQGFDRPDGLVQRPGDAFVVPFFHVLEHDHLALVGGELAQGCPDLAAFQFFDRLPGGLRFRIRRQGRAEG